MPTATTAPAATPTATAQPPAATPTATAQPPAALSVKVATAANLGRFLVDGQGRTLYLYTKDELGKSNCAGNCAQAWPPLMAPAAPTAGEGVTAAAFGTVTRPEGGNQVTYNGWPLYYYAKDAKAGDTTGQDVGNVWFLVGPDGGPIQNAAVVKAAAHPTLGTVLKDRSDRVLYLYTKDELGKSNCAGGCARAWPPVLTVGAPTPGDGANSRAFGTITRADGAVQVTYNGWPLYYYNKDVKPGDMVGQDVGNVWFAASVHGGPIQNAAQVKAAAHATLGTVLMDRSGRTLYLYTKDELGKSNCTGNCALAWPPVLTIGDGTVGEGAQQPALGKITREDGGVQVTYNGWPLYYYNKDVKPGDAVGQDVGNIWFAVSVHGGPIQNAALVKTGAHATLGTILMDRSGRTLYLYTKDELGKSNCTAACAVAWPPVLTIGNATPGDGANAGAFGTIARPDGGNQATYNGWPLYYYNKDVKPGDIVGQDRGNIWFAVSVHGGPIQNAALVKTAQVGTLGTVLVDRSGRTLYLYTRDEPNKSNCAGGCALGWPPVLTIGNATPGDGANAGMFGTTARADGGNQVTYNGHPLYYYNKDVKPGDAVGQNVGGVWFVVTADGNAVAAPAAPAAGSATPTSVPTPGDGATPGY